MPCNHSFPFIIRGKVEIAYVRAYIPRISRSSVPHFRHPSWSWWTISLNSTIRRPSTIQSSLSSGSVELLKGIKVLKLAAARRLLGKLPISCAKHILFLLWPKSNRKCAKIIMAAKTKDYSLRHARVLSLRPACAQQNTHAVLRATAYWLSYF